MTGPTHGARLVVCGVVQGVGFRPHAHRLATELHLAGWVRNEAARVVVEVAGSSGALAEFRRRLTAEAPPLARVDKVEVTSMAPPAFVGFAIAASDPGDGAPMPVPPDVAPCAACLAELADPGDRRHRHPFISCTDCGPRYTIITGLPYDRPATTMAGFPLCAACAAEYSDPNDRRHHAQPICCPDCGPTLRFGPPTPDGGGSDEIGPAALAAAIDVVDCSGTVAVKGLGGYHLAVDAGDDDAVARLRRAKARPDKPFAVMVPDVEWVARLAEAGSAELALLQSPARPIVVLRARTDNPLSELVAPDNPWLGVMLPSSPLHHLLAGDAARPLVMTSANLSGEPIIHRDDGAGLARLADAMLAHDRPIAHPCDDSVVRVVAGRVMPLRLGRGHSPTVLPLADTGRPVLAVGAELKNTSCLVGGGRAWVGPHRGDMGTVATLDAFEAGVDALRAMSQIEPEAVAVDAHPGYVTSRWARRRHPERVVEVQHHHAHVVAVMAEHGLDPDEAVIGIAFDGTGYGDDGTIWGGEVLEVTATGYRRLAHLLPVALPGGDAAISHPARSALAHLRSAGIEWSPDLPPVRALASELDLLAHQLARGVACVPTTSMGRLVDAVASVLGLRHSITYEAQAALDLEHAALGAVDAGLVGTEALDGFAVDGSGRIDPAPVLAAVVAARRRGRPVGEVALGFHRAVIDLVVRLAVVARSHPTQKVVLSGGVFQNVLLTEGCLSRLSADGVDVLTHGVVPPNDGGLALGQATVAAHRRPSPPSWHHRKEGRDVSGRTRTTARPH